MYVCIYVAPGTCEARHFVPLYVPTCSGMTIKLNLNLNLILCKVREDEEQVLLVAPYWPNQTWFPELMLLATAPPWQIPLRRDLLSQRGGTLWHPPRAVPGRDAEVLGGLPPAVVNTITSARAPSTRHAYRLKWNLFVDWCSSRREDPRRCPIAVVLSFLRWVGAKAVSLHPKSVCCRYCRTS